MVQIEPISKTNVKLENTSYSYVKLHAGIERSDKKSWEVTEGGSGRPLKMENMQKPLRIEPDMKKYVECEIKILSEDPGG